MRLVHVPRSLRKAIVPLLVLALPGSTGVAPVHADGYVVPPGFVDELIVGGLDQPVNLAHLRDGRVLVIERVPARIRLVVDGAFAAADPAGVVDSVQTNDPERGLLGIAVDPRWPEHPYVYTYSNWRGGPWIRVSRFTAVGDLAFVGDGSFTLDPASRYDLLSNIPDNSVVHNGGSLRFGPDGMLYVAVGDDNAPCNAMNRTVLAGKILRLDVSRLPAGPGSNPPIDSLVPPDNPFAAAVNANERLVWAWGLRNPYSFAIDALDGTVYIADVGAASFEEVDVATRGGLNFQWPVYEGPRRINVPCASYDSTDWMPPAYAYDRAVGQTVIAGVVYRRPPGAENGFPSEYEGMLFVTDFYTAFLRRLEPAGAGLLAVAPAVPGQPNATDWGSVRSWVSSFDLLPDGSIAYVQNWTSYPNPDGQLRRIRRLVGVADAPGSRPVGEAPLFLGAPAPNPLGPGRALRISLRTEAAGTLSAELLDVRGRRMAWIRPPGRVEAGPLEAAWEWSAGEAGAPSAGLYFVRARLEGAGRTWTVARRVLLL